MFHLCREARRSTGTPNPDALFSDDSILLRRRDCSGCVLTLEDHVPTVQATILPTKRPLFEILYDQPLPGGMFRRSQARSGVRRAP